MLFIKPETLFLYLYMGKANAIRLSTLEAICKSLECQPGDILEYKSDEDSQR